MITIQINDDEFFNDKTNEFYQVKGRCLKLEHSLISLRKWESKWHKPFLSTKDLTNEESLDYVRCMTLTPDVNPLLYTIIPIEEMERISQYIKDPMTATWFSEPEGKKTPPSRKIITAEVIYYWMIELGIPVEFEKWHLNQLLTLIRVINAERTPPKKMSQKDILKKYSKLNAQRKAALRTRG